MNHKISKRLALIALSVSSTGIFVIQAKADPVILLQNQADFSAAITQGYIANFNPTATTSETVSALAALQATYGTGAISEFTATTVSASADVDGLLSTAITSGGSPIPYGTTVICATPIEKNDPDYTGFIVDIKFEVPKISTGSTVPGIDEIGLALFDTHNRVRYWTWDASALTVGEDSFHIDFSDGLGAGGSTGFGVDSGFDLTQVQGLEINYQGVAGTSGLSLGTHQLIVPEPGACTTAGIGLLLGTAGWSLRRKKNLKA